MQSRRTWISCAVALFWGAGVQAQQTETFRQWNQPMEPFQIAGPLYYVGMSNVTSLLLTTPKGHIVIDGAFAESAPRILDNVKTLGFAPADVKIVLSTHAHTDHAGGLAELKVRTGARLLAGAADLPGLARGGRGDFAFGDDLVYPSVIAEALEDGQEVSLGGVTVRAIATPGHTRGCTSYAITLEVDGKPVHVVVVGGTTAPGYRLVGNEKYPTIAADFEATFAKLRTLPCDIFIEGHGFFFGLEDKRAGRRSFVDPEGYAASLAKTERAFQELLEKQRSERR
jgi:metallo-beta-lactamase class B